MANYNIKDEPIELDENDLIHKDSKSFIDRQYELEFTYLSSLNQNLLNVNKNEEIELLNDMFEIDQERKQSEKKSKPAFQNLAYRDKKDNDVMETDTSHQDAKKLKQKNESEQMAFEKKRIINALIESAKDKNTKSVIFSNKFEPLNLNDEAKLLNQLNKLFKDIDENKNLNILIKNKSDLLILRRLKCKLELRDRKRNKNLPIFDIDSYTNELIDSEKVELRKNRIKFELHDSSNIMNQPSTNSGADDDIIFEQEILKTTDGDDCEIIAVKNVLDRFEVRNFKFNNILADNQFLAPIGLVESRYDDVKCLLIRVLKPYIRRDFESIPIKLDLIKKILSKNQDPYQKTNSINSIDYVHLRPEHVMPINIMLGQNFWTGIDISECLEYTDYTIVALYGKLIIGFAFMVPNEVQNQAYLSFIYVHPDWRNLRNQKVSRNVSIGQYMLFYLIEKFSNYEIQLHVSVNSTAVGFYQKFGFKIEEYIKNFYDKYYSNETKMSKDAFLMRLS